MDSVGETHKGGGGQPKGRGGFEKFIKKTLTDTTKIKDFFGL